MAGNVIIISSGATAVPVGPTVEVWVTLISCLVLYLLSVRSLGRRWSLTHYVLFTNLQALVVTVADDPSSSSSSSSNGIAGPDEDATGAPRDDMHHRSSPALNTTTPRKRKHMQQSSSSSSSSQSNMAQEESRRQDGPQQVPPSPSAQAADAGAVSFSVRTLQAGSVTLEALQQRASTILWKRLDTAIVFGAVSSVILCLLRILRRFCAPHFHSIHYMPLGQEDKEAHVDCNELQQEEKDGYQRSFGHVLLGLLFISSLRHWWKLATLAVNQRPPPLLPTGSSSSSMSTTVGRRSKMTEPRTYVHAVFMAGVVHWWCTSSKTGTTIPNTTTTRVENAMEELAVRTLLWFRLVLGQDVLSRLVGLVVSASSENDNDIGDNDDNHILRVLDISIQTLRWILILGTAVIAIQALVEPIQTIQIAIAHQYHVGNHLQHVILPRLVLPNSQSSSSLSWKKRLEGNLRERIFPALRLVLVTFPPLLYVLSYAWSSRTSSMNEDAAAVANNSTVAVTFLESSSWRLFAAWLFVVGLAVYVKSLLQDYLFSALRQVAMLQQEQQQQQPTRSDDLSLRTTVTRGEIFQRRHRGLLYQASHLTVLPILMTILCNAAVWSRPLMMDDAPNMVNPVTYAGPLLDRPIFQQWWQEQEQQYLSAESLGFSWLQSQLFVTRAHPPAVCTPSNEDGEGAGSLKEEEEVGMISSQDQPPVIGIRRPRDVLLRFSTTTKGNSDSDVNNNPPSLLHLLKRLQGLIRASSENEAIRRALLGLDDGDDDDGDDSFQSPEYLSDDRNHHLGQGPRTAAATATTTTARMVHQVHATKRAIRDTCQSLWQHSIFTGRAIFMLVDFGMFVVCLYWILTLAYTMLLTSSRQHSSLPAARLRTRN